MREYSCSSTAEESYYAPAFPQLIVAPIAHPDFLRDTKVWQRHRLRGALLIKHLPTTPTVMLAVGEGEWRATSQANVGVDPLGRCLGIDHRRGR